ncbi:transcriptional regulator [Micromonospora sp. NBC_01655]|uniref:transcriptional regulator n=1 Tax=Micromonospora sp. NBC_01655 TaxID=2975983 RepID=UPI0022537604|nr:transcriptional regulator [Micromonospora sp. NBC_01655]MCX4468977.1 transcriptional regulator [Micromonospora sp. NBC_01655]
MSSLQAIADGLQIDLRLLLGRNAGEEVGNGLLDRVSIDEARGALTRWGPVQLARGQATPTLASLGKAVDHAWLAYQHARYADLVRSLPRLVTDAQQVRTANRCAAAADRLAEAYQVTSAVMRKVGAADLAWLAADRAMAASQDADDQILTAMCAVQLGYALLGQGQSRHAMEVSIALAHQIALPRPLDAPAAHLSIYGTLLIVAARGAAALGYAGCVAELIDQADEAAAVVGDGHDHYWTSFGPTAVQLARVATTVDLGEGAALDPAAHQRLVEGTAFRRLPPERRAAYLLDAANGFMQAGDVATAGQAVVSADRVAPAEVRHRPLGHELLATLLRRAPTMSLDLQRLADEMGVGV